MVTRNMDEIINNINSLVGDTPVAVQIDTAIRSHGHENYITREEYEALQKKVEKLLELVGDTPVPEQIITALQSL